MNINMILQMLNTFGGIKNRLLQLGVDPNELQNVDFNDPNSLNELASRIMPSILKNNPGVANQIKQTANQFVPERGAEIIEIVGN